MECKSCGSTVLKDEYYQNICQECGNVDEMLLLVSDNTPLMSTFMKYEQTDKGEAYKKFKHLYHSYTLTLNTSYQIIAEGELMLPQTWDVIRYKRTKTKKLVIIAMLYLLYRQHRIPVTFSQFLKQAHIPQEKLSAAVQFVMNRFNLPMYSSMNIQDITSNNISELVKLVFKSSTKEMEYDTLLLSQRMVTVIHLKEWGKISSKNYIPLVAIVSTLLAAQYIVSNMTNRKTKNGRKACFRFMTLDYQKMADHMCVHVMAVKKFTKVIQEKLFELVQHLPWAAACIKKSVDVARMLNNLLDYIDIDLKNEEEEAIDSSPSLIPSEVKLLIIQAIQTYIRMFINGNSQELPPLDIEKFKEILNSKEENESSAEATPVINLVRDEVEIKGYTLKLHHLELLKDLLLANCSVHELQNEDYVSLVQKYLDTSSVKDDEGNIEDISDEEMFIYFKDPAFIKREELKIENVKSEVRNI